VSWSKVLENPGSKGAVLYSTAPFMHGAPPGMRRRCCMGAAATTA
jgi:hypothetical protein